MFSDRTELVSVVIPTHARADLADRAVRSVLEQTYPAIELVVVDDASPVSYAPPVQDARRGIVVRTIRLEGNIGPGAAREAGRKAATGAYVAFLDSDDTWTPRFLETVVSALRAEPAAGMAYCTSLAVRDGQTCGVFRGSDRSVERYLPVVLWDRPWPTSACLWRRSVIEMLGAWLPLWSWEDKEYEVRAGCHDVKVAHVAEPLCFVQLDAPDRLSANDPSRDAEDFALALLSIVSNLERTPWCRDPIVRSRIVWLLLTSLILSAARPERSLAWPRVRAAWWWSDRRWRMVALIGASPLLLFPKWPGIVVRLLRWVRGYQPVAPAI